ncbi:transglutaminase-like cysteine peptidase [Bradyrhizobium sp. U87765 SZCCT0131]|uniref:transglutaminase-like cysteine peptidase n=1 Tax=unclassified Bradyrhizobium TaxID=2631580 RepID=UPI001BAA9D48|nr:MULTISPECIES: transglutaminase-like cysteine peptidase [unclassified Bradyrhizobium]MBR1217432.1 transglutaminase-like cysteine peptidase [Bradyrhizobium sp. U87765 SZCCT0131]MBR1264971.1 transglutaminase-like cysteine peptidase [Bradyrhizobium sp. U87765 SZCCT0134]MBR1304953.1 transglutaminase-like cysteine peptidase [Bradyrhizobium sp. U87765 SZCCT0110]MBR1320739.1 transglutaminase-like cysteine peptidase [Bradyrhizobium sp. U87765 SZCCT0109]MBR1349159.1 transglutaminase-like cysteine pep
MLRAALFRPVLCAAIALACLTCTARVGAAAGLYVKVGAPTSTPPIGWVQFCQTYSGECDTQPLPPRDIVLTDEALHDLGRLNAFVNRTIRPMTDREHYGMVQWWRYPDDGAGACHSYALLKRRLLIQAGWPRQALLMTIVRQTNGEGHAVLTVKTDRGEYILDNMTDEILPWSQTSYGFHKRQSQDDPNQWVWLEEARADMATASPRTR